MAPLRSLGFTTHTHTARHVTTAQRSTQKRHLISHRCAESLQEVPHHHSSTFTTNSMSPLLTAPSYHSTKQQTVTTKLSTLGNTTHKFTTPIQVPASPPYTQFTPKHLHVTSSPPRTPRHHHSGTSMASRGRDERRRASRRQQHDARGGGDRSRVGEAREEARQRRSQTSRHTGAHTHPPRELVTHCGSWLRRVLNSVSARV